MINDPRVIKLENGASYLPVKARMADFRKGVKQGHMHTIATSIVTSEPTYAVVHAMAYDIDLATGNEELIAEAFSMRAYSEWDPHFLESAETAAIGRALSDAGYNLPYYEVKSGDDLESKAFSLDDGKKYLNVVYRVASLRQSMPNVVIRKKLVNADYEKNCATFEVQIYVGNFIIATAHATRSYQEPADGEDAVNWFEHAETAAIGRACTMLGFDLPESADLNEAKGSFAETPVGGPRKQSDIIPQQSAMTAVQETSVQEETKQEPIQSDYSPAKKAAEIEARLAASQPEANTAPVETAEESAQPVLQQPSETTIKKPRASRSKAKQKTPEVVSVIKQEPLAESEMNQPGEVVQVTVADQPAQEPPQEQTVEKVAEVLTKPQEQNNAPQAAVEQQPQTESAEEPAQENQTTKPEKAEAKAVPSGFTPFPDAKAEAAQEVPFEEPVLARKPMSLEEACKVILPENFGKNGGKRVSVGLGYVSSANKSKDPEKLRTAKSVCKRFYEWILSLEGKAEFDYPEVFEAARILQAYGKEHGFIQ